MIDKSIYNISRKKCSGCKMCADICPKKAISFEYTRGFWYPLVDDNKCINCGLCRKKCPSLNEAPNTLLEPVACYGAKSKNEQIRESSTSGGFFSELAINWMLNGGYCIAALYNEDNKIIHHVSNNIADIDLFRQSKYAQSDTQGIYKKARHLLQDGKKVLFCGTACQVEALKAFLGKEYENLVTMDFVCLGIGSPFVFRKYLNMLEKKYGSKIVRVWFKNKSLGWRNISTKVDFENGKTYLEPGYGDLFMMAFVSDALSIRPNCEFCKFRKIPHNSDFTVADFWGIEKINPSFDDNKGLSAVFVNSRKGYDIFSSISSNLDYFETSAKEICQGNFSTLSPMSPNPNSELFMDYLETHSLQEAMHKYGSYKGLKKIRIFYRRYRRFLSEIIKI